jgi:hypothetical protein
MMMMRTMSIWLDESAVVRNRFASRLKILILKENLAAEGSTFHRCRGGLVPQILVGFFFKELPKNADLKKRH